MTHSSPIGVSRPRSRPLARQIAIVALAAALVACDAPVGGPDLSVGPGTESADAVILAAPRFPAAPRPRRDTAADSDLLIMEPAIIAPPMEAPSPIPSPAAAAPGSTSPGGPAADVLTAGDIDDGRNLAAFAAYARKARADTRLPLADLSAPVMARLTGPDGRPAPGLRVTLRRPGADAAFWDGYSGVDGVITVFPALHGAGPGRGVEMRVFPASGADPVVQQIAPRQGRVTVALPFAGGWSPDFLDLVFVVDTTGSMGDELDWLTYDLSAVVQAATRRAPGVSIRYGLVLYRDEGDDYVVRNLGFTGSLTEMRRRFAAQSASGGGDYPEAMDAALASAMGLDWRRGRGERLMFLIADAPPHDENAGAFLAAARSAAQSQVQIFGLAASGVAAEAEFLMRQAAVQTGGRYLFLTDDSGVGAGNAEPTISCYRVTTLSSQMFRVIASELDGRRIEAPQSEVLREVGTYANGICRD